MRPSARIMVVDDEKIVRESLAIWLQKSGYDAQPVEGGEQAMERLEQESWDIILVDLKMPRVDGIQVLRRALEIFPDLPVLLFTAYGTVETAVEAMRVGAYDYLIKPVDPDVLALKVQKIAEGRHLAQENATLRKKIDSLCRFDEIVGTSPAIQSVLERVESVAKSDATVLITGESGTGKELIARVIHRNSERRYKPLIAVSIGALPVTLVESELFGYEKGAFTGADHVHLGKIELADGGTLFLDEVGDMDPKVQVDLLRVLEERSFYRLGGGRETRTNVRIVSATNKDLQQAITEGAFREDLYYRLNVVEIHLPPLRERGDDVLLLATHFLERFREKMNKKVTGFSPEVLQSFSRYEWPGNVRQLENVIERALVLGRSNRVEIADLCFGEGPASGGGEGSASLREVERRHILRVLGETSWNVTRAAQLLEIDRATLYKKIKKYGFSRPEGHR